MPIFIHYTYADQEHYGRLEGGERIQRIAGSPFEGFQTTGEFLPLADARVLSPCRPTKVIAVGLNYRDHAREFNLDVPHEPLIFMKPASAIIGPREPIVTPSMSQRVDFEAELGVVMGRTCRRVKRDQARDYILGYTCVNDVTAPELLFANEEFHQWCRSKSLPGFGPIGPVIATGIDPASLRVRGVLDGEVKQDYPVSDMIFSPQQIVWHIAREIVLYPGDVIACGTSVGAADMAEGQTIVVEIPGIGSLTNRLTGNDSPGKSL